MSVDDTNLDLDTEQETRKPKFEKGDLVRHRASGELGIISYVGVVCLTHPGLDALSVEHLSGVKCEWAFSGSYSVSLGFTKDSFDTPEFEIELAPSSLNGEVGKP